MSEKYLGEKEWKAFAKGADYKDAALLKALASLDKAGRAPGSEQAKALDELGKQLDALRKQHKADKKLAAQLDKMDAELESRRKDAQAARSDEEEEEDSPALLTTKIVPLMREVRKGNAMRALVATAGRDAVVLVSRKAIAPARRKLLTEQLGVTSGVKFIPGECLFEENAYTFVLATQAAGMAKKIRAALLQQTEMRFKVRVRGEDPDDIDDDGEQAEDAGEEGGAARAAAKAQPAPEQRAYEARWAALEPRYAKALRESGPDASKLRGLQAFAETKAGGGNFAAALQAVESMEKLLPPDIPPAPPLPPAGPKKSGDPAQAFTARLTALIPRIKDAAAHPTGQDIKLKASEAGVFARKKEFDRANALLDEAEQMLKELESPQESSAAPVPDLAAQREVAKTCLQIWRDAKDEADAGLSRLQGALRSSGEPALERIAEMGLNGVSRGLQVGLRVAMEEFARQSDPAGGAAQKLRRSVSDFRRFLDTDPAVQLCDDNPFGVKVELRALLGKALGELDRQLDAIIQ